MSAGRRSSGSPANYGRTSASSTSKATTRGGRSRGPWRGRGLVGAEVSGPVAIAALDELPLVAVLGHGELRITRTDGASQNFYLSGGVLQMAADVRALLRHPPGGAGVVVIVPLRR